MRCNKRVGEILVCAEIDGEGREYLLRPSFYAMSQIGEPKRIESAFGRVRMAMQVMVYGKAYTTADKPSLEQLNDCINVIHACSDDNLPDALLGWFQPSRDESRLLYREGALSWKQIVVLADHLMRWGMVGEPDERRSRVWVKGQQKKSDEPNLFDPAEYVGMAIHALHLSKDDAWNLTMFEFQRAFDKAYPIDESKVMPSQDEAEEAMDKARQIRERKKQMNIQPRKGKMSDIANLSDKRG